MKLLRFGSLPALFLGLLALCKADRCDLDIWQYEYLGNCYYFVDKVHSWYEAKHICVEMGGTLASIHNKEENNFIKEKSRGKKRWLGIVGVSLHPIIYGWEDRTVVDFQNWNSSEPNGKSLEEMCGEMSTSGKWRDTSCEHKHMAVCKKTLAVSTTDAPRSTKPFTTASTKAITSTITSKSTANGLRTTIDTDSKDACHSFTWDRCLIDFGEPIVKTIEADPIDCQDLCSGIYFGTCWTFDYNFHHKNCILYKKKVQHAEDECKTYGGPKDPLISYCQQHEQSCMEFWYTGCEYEGFHLQTYPQISSTEVCQTICREYEDGCNYWVYDFESQECATYSNHVYECERLVGPSDYAIENCYKGK